MQPISKSSMSISRRQHIRFSLDIPAVRYTKFGEKIQTLLSQISIGGCLAEWEDSLFTGDEFRLEIRLPNKNWLPLKCKVLYKSENNGVGVKFLDITRFEQELVAKIISDILAQEGLPIQVDPFGSPQKIVDIITPRITDNRREREEMLQQIMSGDNS